jgi:hypothetical protein
LDVLLDSGRDGLRGPTREVVEKIGVGRVGERIASGLYDSPSIEVAIGKRITRVA